MCTLYQIMCALTSFLEWSVPDSGSLQTISIRQGCAACIGGCQLHTDTDYGLKTQFFYKE